MRQYRSVLTNAGFITWANEHVVVLVAHNELGHDAEEVEGTVTEPEEEPCPLYPGLTCRDHLNAAVDIDNARDEELIQVPFIELCPNTWLVTPLGDVIRVEEKDQFVAKKIREQTAEVQKKLGAALGVDVWTKARPLLARATKAYDEERWHDALEALAAFEPLVAEPHPSLRTLLDARLQTLDEEVELAADDVLEGDEITEEVRALARRLLEATDVKVYGKHVPVHDRLAAWLDAN